MNTPKITGRVTESTITEDQLRLLMLTRAISPSTYLWATTGEITDRGFNPNHAERDRDRRNRDEARARAALAWNARSS